MPALSPLPEQFGRYRILKKLGEGGMGTVYLAEDTKLGRRVALKVPQLDGENPAVIQRFYREAKVAARLEHPNLCPVLDVGDVDGVHFLTMPFLDGTPLSQLIDESHPWPVKQTVELVCRLARALQVMHEAEVIHRDLKPANIMIRKDGQPVLMDFGLARSLGAASQNLTRLGASLGTPGYMSPEQVTGDLKALGPASDVYSLGVVLYELLTGQRPFPGPSINELFGQILHAVPEPPSARRGGLDARLDAVCLRALAKKPGERYASMLEFVSALEGSPGQAALTGPAPQPVGSGSVSPAKTMHAPSGIGPTLPPPNVSSATGPLHPTITNQPGESPIRRVTKARLLIGAALGAIVLLVAVCIWFAAGNKDGSGGTDNGSPQGGDKKLTNSIGMKLVWISPGTFVRAEHPPALAKDPRLTGKVQHEVEITSGFHLGAYEVTQDEYSMVMGKNPSYQRTPEGKEDRKRLPVDNVSWEDAAAFCKALSARAKEMDHGRVYRLPTEAEWEYACRAGTRTAFSFGDTLSYQQANVASNHPENLGVPRQPLWGRPAPVGSYPANPWGLHDMHGNLFEWCQDWYENNYYARSPRQDPPGAKEGTAHVFRGGAFGRPGIEATSYERGDWKPDIGMLPAFGFRVACDVGRKQ